MDRSAYTQANRLAWNEAAPIHRKQKFDQLLANFCRPGYSCLDPVETAILHNIGLTGKAVAQVCCNNGRELLSVKNLGAARCVGFDISDAFIDQARQLATAGGIDCEFVRADIYDIPAAYHRAFDLVYITIGALCWMPDLQLFFQIVARLLKPQGWLFIYEVHPVLYMFEPSEHDDPPRAQNCYFRREPWVDEEGLDYYGMTTYKSLPLYSFLHKLSDIITGCLNNGLTLKSFTEYDHDITNLWAHFAHFRIKPPLCYTLVAQAV
jgi:ubiquinone/menaquinone biosynthesis C-methylase UbiE